MDDFEDDVTYCVYCYDEVSEDRQYKGCCGEVHYVTYRDMYPDEQEQFLEAELEEYEEWAKKEANK